MAEKRYEADHVPSSMEDEIVTILYSHHLTKEMMLDKVLKLMDELVEQNITDCDSCARVDPADYCPEPEYDEGRI